MPQIEQFETLGFGSGQGGKLLPLHLAQSGQRTSDFRTRLGTAVDKVMATVGRSTCGPALSAAPRGRFWRMQGWR
jgi:hypothetical protein